MITQNKQKVTKNTSLRRKCDFKKVNIHFHLNFLPRVDTLTSACFLKQQQKNLKKLKNAIIPQYLISKTLFMIFNCGSLSLFQHVL